jgi:predicted nuclease of predicted toxin-antitoxin system
MTIWVNAHLSPSLAPWITETFGIPAKAVRDLGLREAKDFPIFEAAREANAIVLTKDADFPHLLSQHGPPPKVLWLTCGNTSNQHLHRILRSALESALELLKSGESMVEITGANKPD